VKVLLKLSSLLALSLEADKIFDMRKDIFFVTFKVVRTSHHNVPSNFVENNSTKKRFAQDIFTGKKTNILF